MITETRIAFIQHLASNRLEVRLKPAAHIGVAEVAEVMATRMELCRSKKVGIMLFIPHDVDLDLAVMNMDHYRINASAEGLLAVAVVVDSMMMESMSRLYIAYFPPSFPAQIFTAQEEADTWLNGQLERRGD